MRRIFVKRPIYGANLYLAWAWFRVVRQSGSPDAGKIDTARAGLEALLRRDD